MRKFAALFFLMVVLSCDKDSNVNDNNPYLPNYPVNVQLNLNLPEYNGLNYVSNPVYVNLAGSGIRGLIVMKTGEGMYNAFDRACPNQALSDCSTMTISGINALCPCDEKEYSLYSGQAAGVQYPMKKYRVELMGNYLRIFN
ncbi:hypothetical protein [Flavobacterium pedocola]